VKSRQTEKLGFELALLAVLAFLWGSSYLLIRVALDTIPPITLIAARVLIATLFLFIVMSMRREHLPRDFRTWRMLFVQAVFNSIGAWTVLAWGQQYVESSLASVLNSTSPVFVFLITRFFTRHETTDIVRFAGASLGVFGVTLIVGIDALHGLGQQVVAQLAILLGAVLYAGAAIYGKNFTHLPSTVTAAGTMIWATVCLVPLSLIVEHPWTLAPSIMSLLSTVVLAVFCTGVALLIYFRLVKTLGSLGAASQSYLRSGIGVLLGVIVLGEHISFVVGIGIATAVLGVVAINAPQKI